RVIDLADLGIQRPEVVEHAEAQQSRGQQVENASKNFPYVESMDAEQAKKGEQNPGNRIVHRTVREPLRRFAVHRRNEERIDEPANAQQAQGEEPDRAGYRLAVIKAVRTREAKNPKDVSDRLAVCVSRLHCVTAYNQEGSVRPLQVETAVGTSVV